jgi:hypothetical protein
MIYQYNVVLPKKTNTYLDQHHCIKIKIKLKKLGIMFYLNINVRKYRLDNTQKLEI